MTGYERKVLKTLSITVVVTISLLFVFIPLMGEVGAAIAISSSIVLWNVLMAIDVFRMHRLKTWIR